MKRDCFTFLTSVKLNFTRRLLYFNAGVCFYGCFPQFCQYKRMTIATIYFFKPAREAQHKINVFLSDFLNLLTLNE